MDIRMIVVDMDGTLLNEVNKITARTIEVLQKAEDRGIMIVPATGRCRALLPDELRQNLNIRYAILENGAEIWDYKENKAVYQSSLPEGIAAQVYDRIKGHTCFAEFFRNGEAYSEMDCFDRLMGMELDQNFVNYFRRNHIFVRTFEKLPEVLRQTKKINMYNLEPSLRLELDKFLQDAGNCAMTSSVFDNLEVQNRKTGKGEALNILCERTGVSRKEVIAFGDGDNDLQMLQCAGIGIAMSNATEKTRNAADEVARSNKEEGVAVYLEKFLANNVMIEENK